MGRAGKVKPDDRPEIYMTAALRVLEKCGVGGTIIWEGDTATANRMAAEPYRRWAVGFRRTCKILLDEQMLMRRGW